jgi:hypothetical protein
MSSSLHHGLLLLVFPLSKIPTKSQNPKMWVKIRVKPGAYLSESYKSKVDKVRKEVYADVVVAVVWFMQ